MRLISIIYLLSFAAVIVVLVYPGHELAGARIWLTTQYNVYIAGGDGVSSTVTQIVGMLTLAATTLFAVMRAFDL